MSQAFLLKLSRVTHVLFVTPSNLPGSVLLPFLPLPPAHITYCTTTSVFCFHSYLSVFFRAVFSAWQIWVYFIQFPSPQETESHRSYKQVIRRDLMYPKARPSFLTLSNIGTAPDQLCPSLIIVAKSPQFLPQHTPPAVITWGMVLYLQLMDFNSPGDTSRVRGVFSANGNSLFRDPWVKAIFYKITQKTLLHWTTYVLSPNSGKNSHPVL